MAIPAAASLATRIPNDRSVPGLEYGPLHGDRRFVRPSGCPLWGLARELPGTDLPDDATIFDELDGELGRWDHLPPAFYPAVAILLKDGGIRAASEGEEYRAALQEWAWKRLAERLEERGADPTDTIAGRHLKSALQACYRSPALDRLLEMFSKLAISALNSLDGVEAEPGATRRAITGRLTRAANRVLEARALLEETWLQRDETYRELWDHLSGALVRLDRARSSGDMTSEELLALVAAAKRLIEPVWVRASGLQEASAPGEAEVASPIPA